MSRLVVIRHAKSDYPWGVDDHDRPLNERGRRDAPHVGRWLDEHLAWDEGDRPAVRVSTARRAQLTWELARAQLADRWASIEVVSEPRIYEAGVRDLQDVIAGAAASSPTVIVVGHNPGLASLVHLMAVDDALRDEATSKFPTSAIAVLESELPLAEAMATPGSLRVSSFAVPRG